ncbi:hypothetical protein [Bosea sp. (in: a-proteobacteria)]|uniref:hypothetical protein n=1 Tax=Bosea sp. (in: a-proteobacteria) TaxID=1871050 RepID=UPI003B3A1918
MTAIRLHCDGSSYGALANLYAAAGKRAPVAVRRAVQRKGGQALVRVTRAVRDRLRVKLREVRRRIKGRMISGTSYEIVARGRIPLKEFDTVQDGTGVKVDHIPTAWVADAAKLRIAFQAKKGAPRNQPGNAAKRRGTLAGRIVYGTGKRRREGFKSVGGVMVPSAFVDSRAQREFEAVARELPEELAHQLWVVIEGVDMRAQAARVARGRYLRKGR